MSRAVVIDTDPGIDDAIAILAALGMPELRVLAITTVAGNVGLEVTTRNALRLLALAGRTDIPVHPGAASSLERFEAGEARIHGDDGVGGVALPEPAGEPAEAEAVAALAAILEREPAGSVDVLALAPLTNLARLVRDAPGAAGRIGRVIAMGGAVEQPGNRGARAEFNLGFDPEAADLVLRAGLMLTLIPLDATRQLRADRRYLDRLGAIGTPGAETVRALIGAYFARAGEGASRPLHDPCVPLLATRPGLFGCRRMRLDVVTGASADAGALVRGEHPVDVAMTVAASDALDTLAQALGA